MARRSWWLLARAPGDVEICVKDPGFETDVVVDADLRAFTEVILGRRTLSGALRERLVKLHGPAALLRRLTRWLPLRGEAMRGMGLAPPPGA